MAVYKRGTKYWVRFQFRGKEIRKPAHTGVKSEAQEYERELRSKYARIARGSKPRITFAEARDKFVNEYFVAQGLAHSSQERYLTSLIALETFFADEYIDEINTRPRIIDFANHRIAEGVSPEKDLACLSSLMSYMETCEVIEVNAVIRIKKKLLRKKKARVKFANQKEFPILLSSLDPKLIRLAIFAKETGMREEEQLSLTEGQIDRKAKEAHLLNTKNGLSRIVPLSDLALAQIPARKNRPGTAYLFTNENGLRYAWNVRGLPCFRKAWEGALRRAAKKASVFNDFTWHDLRHTFASWAIKGWHEWQDKKMPIADLSKWLGHQSLQQTMRYAHLDVEDLHGSMNDRTETGTGARDYA